MKPLKTPLQQHPPETTQVGCRDIFRDTDNMNHGDCDNAVAMLKAQFPTFVRSGVSFYSISNSVW